jgi:hypothetical protein
MTTQFNQTEREIVALKSAWDSIDDMVNYSMFMKLQSTKETELHFKTERHQRLFNVLLVDFLSQPRVWPFGLGHPPANASESDRSILFHLRRTCREPHLGASSIAALSEPLDAFVQWLEGECTVEDVWLPSIELKTNIKVKRITFIKICGNIGKHNFARLGADVVAICDVLKANGTSIDPAFGYLVLPEFYDWFHDNVFSYHSSAIAEFLNNIRWGIYDYLRPEFLRSFTKDDPGSLAYRFDFPADCAHLVARTIYWDLMNAVRSEPYMPRFTVTRYLKMRF